MGQEDKIIFNNGIEEKEYSILITFDIKEKQKSYILYTDYSKDDNGKLRIFSSIYDKDGILKPVIEEDELKLIDEYIKDLESDLNSGIQLI